MEKPTVENVGSEPLIPKAAFIGLEDQIHLAAAGETPPLRSHADAVLRFMEDKSTGMPGRIRFEETAERVRGKASRLVGLSSDDIAFLINASDGLNTAAAGLVAAPGDNIVVAPADFPSVVLAATALTDKGVSVRPAGKGLLATSADYERAVNENTRAILVSHVSQLTGARQDLLALRRIADTVGARLIVDASHAIGVVPVDGSLCDVIVSCCYKWLLGVHGCGLFFLNTNRWPDLTPLTRGWHSVVDPETVPPITGHRLKSSGRRFESGNPPYLPLYILENGLDHILAIAPSRRFAHCEALTRQLRNGLAEMGAEILTPAAAEHRAGSISIASKESMTIEEKLRKRRVLVWAGEGRVRISAYLYNNADDVTYGLEALANAL